MAIASILHSHQQTDTSMSSHIGHWYYESDGGGNNRTFYVWRYNDAEKGGIERKDFSSKQNAMRFLKDVDPREHRILEREERELLQYKPFKSSRP